MAERRWIGMEWNGGVLRLECMMLVAGLAGGAASRAEADGWEIEERGDRREADE